MMFCENCGVELQDPDQKFCLNCGIPLRIKFMLKQFLETNPWIKAAAIVSADGLPIASALSQGVDETNIAAMTAALLSLAKRSIIEFQKGDFDTLYAKGSMGYLLIFQVGLNALLIISKTADVKLGLVFLDLLRNFDSNLQ